MGGWESLSKDNKYGVIFAAAAAAVILVVVIIIVASGSSGGGSGNGPYTPTGPVTTVQPAAQKTLTRIQKTGGGGAAGWSTTHYNNYWSDGSVTSCTVTDFPDGAVSANGNCAPDGIANGMTPGNVPAN